MNPYEASITEANSGAFPRRTARRRRLSYALPFVCGIFPTAILSVVRFSDLLRYDDGFEVTEFVTDVICRLILPSLITTLLALFVGLTFRNRGTWAPRRWAICFIVALGGLFIVTLLNADPYTLSREFRLGGIIPAVFLLQAIAAGLATFLGVTWLMSMTIIESRNT